MLVYERSEVEGMLARLVISGVTVTNASRMLGLTPSQGFYVLGKRRITNRAKRRPYVPVKTLDTAEEMIEKGFTIDVIAAGHGSLGPGRYWISWKTRRRELSAEDSARDFHELIAWLRMLVARMEAMHVGPEGKVYLTLDEAVQFSAIPLGTLRENVREGELPAYKPGKNILIKWGDLKAFIERHQVAGTPFTEPERTLSGRTKKLGSARTYPLRKR